MIVVRYDPIVFFALLAVTACGGTSDSNSSSQTDGTFSSFSTLPDSGVTELPGQAVTASYDADLATGDAALSNATQPGSSTAFITTQNGNSIARRISAPGSSVSFDERNGDVAFTGRGFTALETADGRSVALVADEASQGFEHQTFGVWITGVGTGSGTVGAGSYGARTSSARIPRGQTANYTGTAAGIARRSDGQLYVTDSTVNVTTDFSTVGISSAGTQATNINTTLTTSASELDFSGNGIVSGSGFSANVAGAASTGRADGAFYGPDATEVGGTYRLTGPGGVVHTGAFGGN